MVGRPGVASTLIGVSRIEQMADNVAAPDVHLSPEHLAALEAATAPAEPSLYDLFRPAVRRHVTFGGASVSSGVIDAPI